MARDQVDMTPIDSRDELVAWFEAGCKPEAQFRVGTEHEKFAFTVDGHAPGALRRAARHPRAARGHAAPARLGADHGGRQHHRPRRRRPAAARSRWSPAASSNCPARRSRPSTRPAASCNAHLAQVREVARAARHRLPRPRHARPKWTPRRDAGDAEVPLRDHDALHAEGRHARPRHDVPHLHGAGQPRLRLRSRHGAQDARVAGAAAGRHRAVRQLAVHRRQAERLPVVPRARSGATPTTSAPACCRSRSSRASASSAMSIGARRADVFRQARRPLHRRGRHIVPRVHGRQARTMCRASAPTIGDWANHSRRCSPTCG